MPVVSMASELGPNIFLAAPSKAEDSLNYLRPIVFLPEVQESERGKTGLATRGY
jgi:hypothetical protein